MRPSSWSASSCSAELFLAQQLAELLAERRRDILAGKRISNVGRKEADLRSAIEAAPLELQAVERLPLGELDHGVGDLNLSAGAALLSFENLEDFRLENVTAGDDEIGRRLVAWRFLDHAGDRE